MEAQIGTTLGSYKLTAVLGTGTTGQCFAAVDSKGSAATVKVLHPALSLFTKVEGYWDELQQIAALANPHIATPHAADWSKSGRFFLVSEPLDGLDLHAALAAHGRLPPSQVLLFAGQVCLALDAAHDAGHTHGALKPHNIFLVRRGSDPAACSTRVLDFATARLVTASAPGSGTPGGAGVPDPAYLAPEQFKGPATPASDLYALGVILYESLSGRRPFVGSYDQLAKLHASEKPLPPQNIPAGLRDVVLRLLAKDPKERFASAGELLAAIEGWAAGAPPELEQPGVALFAKAEGGAGVAQEEGEQTVKVAIDDLSLAMEQEQKDAEREVLVDTQPIPNTSEKKQPMADAKSSKTAEPTAAGSPTKSQVPQDQELAAIAEKAASSLRVDRAAREEKPADPSPAPAKPAPEVEAYFDEDDELVELPLEKSVKAFVATLSPIVAPPRAARPGGNGESLDAALDQFVRDAKAMSAALPPPVLDDRRLAELAKIPVEEPPAPKIAPVAPVAPAVVAPVVTPAAEGRERSILLPSVLSFLIGGALVFGAYKLFLEKPPAAVDGSAGGSGAAVTPPPKVDEKGGTPSAAPLADSGAAAPATQTATARVDAAPAAAATPDAAPAAASAPDAATAPTPKKVAKKVAKKAVKKVVPAVVKKKVEPKAKKDKKEKKGGSDWVDPFSQ